MKQMKSSTRLDSIVFQLTPTRTRCDLVITANGKSEKIASGLLNPFLAHLKAAEEQIGKGGYSVVLEPKHGSDAAWFTKGTVERFVRFVSSPEILERVYTIESEILQIEKAISLQSSNNNGLHNVEDLQVKSEARPEGSKSGRGCNEEKQLCFISPPAINQRKMHLPYWRIIQKFNLYKFSRHVKMCCKKSKAWLLHVLLLLALTLIT